MDPRLELFRGSLISDGSAANDADSRAKGYVLISRRIYPTPHIRGTATLSIPRANIVTVFKMTMPCILAAYAKIKTVIAPMVHLALQADACHCDRSHRAGSTAIAAVDLCVVLLAA